MNFAPSVLMFFLTSEPSGLALSESQPSGKTSSLGTEHFLGVGTVSFLSYNQCKNEVVRPRYANFLLVYLPSL